MPKRTGRRIVAVALLALALAAGAALAATAQTGAYRANGAISFRFSLRHGYCYLAPKNLTNPNARRGAGGTGTCFGAPGTAVPVKVTCTQGATESGVTVLPDIFERLRLAGGRSLHVKAYTYGSDPKPVGWTEFDLQMSGSHGSGFIRDVGTLGSGAICDTGKLSFTAHRS